MKKLKQIWWFILDRCTDCGGELSFWDFKRGICKKCGKVN